MKPSLFHPAFEVLLEDLAVPIEDDRPIRGRLPPFATKQLAQLLFLLLHLCVLLGFRYAVDFHLLQPEITKCKFESQYVFSQVNTLTQVSKFQQFCIILT
jgi:hypothetical protein